MPFGKFKKVYNPDNSRLYTVIAESSPILDEMCRSNPSRIPEPEPPEVLGPYSTSSNFGKKSSSGRSRKRKKELKKMKKDLWGT